MPQRKLTEMSGRIRHGSVQPFGCAQGRLRSGQDGTDYGQGLIRTERKVGRFDARSLDPFGFPLDFARDMAQGRLNSLGTGFAGTGNKNDAGKAYDKAAKNYRGEFASLNLNR